MTVYVYSFDYNFLQEEEARKVTVESAADAGAPVAAAGAGTGGAGTEGTSEEALLEQAISMSMGQSTEEQTPSVPDFSSMSEEDQIAYALQMSMANSGM